jgi:hypothetical protein
MLMRSAPLADRQKAADAHAPPARRMAATPLSILQRGIGNHAVARLLQRCGCGGACGCETKNELQQRRHP